MDASFSRSQTPSGGWIFHDPHFGPGGWSEPQPVASTFGQVVQHIIKLRLGTPAITVKFNLATSVDAVSNELENFTRARLGMAQSGAGFPKQMPPPSSAPSLSQGVRVAVDNVKKMAAGAAELFDWEVSGLAPEPADVSAKRAATCAVCPKNEAGGLAKYFKEPIANNIRKRLARLHAMNLTTPDDAKLDTCSACLCILRLKCHEPAALVLKHLKPEVRADLHPDCWVLKLT
jgi:hypothetical protein